MMTRYERERVRPTTLTTEVPRSSTESNVRVLAIDDDPLVRQLIVDCLGDHDIHVRALDSGRNIVDIICRDTFDLVIVDLKMPGENGMEITSRLRKDSDVPIIMLTGRKDEADRVMGLEFGADDYVTKPFSPRELVARIRALLRRTRARETTSDALSRIRAYRFAGRELNVRLRRLTMPDGKIVALTNNEFNLLVAFLAAPQRVLSRDRLLELSRLHNDEVYDRAIDVQVGRLRKKVDRAHMQEQLISTERGVGYALSVPVEIVR